MAIFKGRRHLVVAALCVLVIILATPRFLNLVSAAGHFIRAQKDMQTDYAKALFWSIALGGSILFWPISFANKKHVLVAWCAKVVVTLGVMLLYENTYGLDAYMYFEESHGAFSWSALGLTRGTENMISLARLHRELFPDSYHAMKVTFAMLGLIGIYLFYRAAAMFFQREDSRIFYILAFFPGILFWSSILGKDPLVFLGIATYSYGVVGFKVRRRLRFVVPILLGILIATFIRQWLAVILVIPLATMMLVAIRGMGTKLVIAAVAFLGLLVSAQPLMNAFKIEAASDILSVADKTTKNFANTAGGSTQEMDVDLTSTSGILMFMPRAAFTALFRPLPGDVLNPFGLLASLESSYLLLLLFLSVKRSRLRDLSEPLVLWAVTFLVVWSLINGIVSSTNFGLAVRYKLQVLPVMLGILLYLSRKRVNGDQTAPGAPESPVPAEGV